MKNTLQILDEMPVFYNLNAIEKREVLVVILQIIRNLDDTTLIKAWQQSIARTRLFFKLLEECITHFEVRTTVGYLDCWKFLSLSTSVTECDVSTFYTSIITLTSKISVHKRFLMGVQFVR